MSEINENETAAEGSTDNDLRVEIEKLRAKNRELLAEKQKARQKAQEAQDAADEAAAQAAENTGNVEALRAAHAKELKKLQERLDASDADLRTIRVDNEIARAISEGDVRPEMVRAVTAMLKAEVVYENGSASIDGKPIADHVSKFLAGKEGAHFVRASDNSGSGAIGSANAIKTPRLSAPPKTDAEWKTFDSLEVAERNSLADSWNMPSLKL